MTDAAMPQATSTRAATSGHALADWPAWALILGLAAAYFATARLGLLLAIPGGHVTPVWPPSGIALAALLLCGGRVAPGIWLGSFAANLWDFVGSPMGLATEMATSATFGAGALAAALLGQRLLRRFVGRRNPLGRVRDVWFFMILGGAASALVSATVGVTALCWSGFAPWSAYAQVWLTWWLGDTAGVFVVAPLLLVWRRTAIPLRWTDWLEAACALGLVTAATFYVFAQNSLPLSGKPLAFTIIPFLVWPAMRFGARGAATAVALIAAMAVWGTIHGMGPFAVGSRNESLLMLELFLSVVVLTAMCIAAIVTEREQAEAAQRSAFEVLEQRVRERTAQLVDNQRHFADLFELAPDALVMVNSEGSIMQVNRQAEALFGWTRVDLVGQPIEVLMPEPFRAGHAGPRQGFMQSAAARAMAAGQPNLRGLRKDGTAFPMDISLGPLQIGSDLAVVAAVRDTTEREQLSAALRQSAALYRNTLDSMLEGCQVVGFDWRCRYVNAVAARHNRQPPDALIGRTLMETSPGIEATALFEKLQRCMVERTGQHCEIEWVFADGTRGWYEVSVQPALEGISIFSVETTERKRAELEIRVVHADLERRIAERTEELLTARDAAEQANRAKSAFLAAMSHEIRTPMNGVVGMIDVLEQSNLRRSQAELVKTIRQSALALLAIVDDVLDFSKIEAGVFEIDRQPMDVAAVVEGVCDTLDHLAQAKDVLLLLFVDPDLPCQLAGDALRLRQVLLNLVSNAVKFSSASERAGRVSVRAGIARDGAHPAMLVFSVTDNGIGMDHEVLARLFTPFTQADAGTTRRFGGTGLGLSISHRLVGLMGGSIKVQSEPGRGSTFSVRMPLQPLSPAAGSGADADGFGLAGLACLVLGDSQGQADDLGVYLAHSGALVQRAVDRAAVGAWFGRCAPGRCVVVDADDGEGLDRSLAGWRAAGRARPGLEAGFVVIERGRRRKPRDIASDVIGLDGNVLRRAMFLSAVAQAAGRRAAEVAEAPVFDTAAMPALLSTRQAGAQGMPILVAEDNEINQKVLTRQLALLGYTADIACNGREALDWWRRGHYALLLTDLHMPRMDGYELTVAIRQAEAAQQHMPIIALTANALKGEARRCLALGMDDYMTKPVQLVDLKAMLGKWLPPALGSAPTGQLPRSVDSIAPPAVDVRVLEALVGDELQVVAGLLQDFRIAAADAATQMRNACQADDAAELASVAHRLKSSARSVGALLLGELCEGLEEAGRAGKLDALAEQWPAFEAQMKAADDFLAAWRVRAEPQLARMGDLP